MVEILILASRSPRRQELLRQVGIPFEIDTPEVDETCDFPAGQAVEELSRRKALKVRETHGDRWILAADTLVSVDGRTLGKPTDEADAFRMLKSLCGKTHQVYTGVTVFSPGGWSRTACDRSDVTFCDVPDAELIDYIRGGEPMDKAGAYAIQGRAALWIPRVEGCISSVIGLPLYLVRELLLEAEFPLNDAL